MKQEELTKEDLEVLGVIVDAEAFNELKTYFHAARVPKEEFLKICVEAQQNHYKVFGEYMLNALTSRVFELERQISVNEIRDKDTEDSLLDVVGKLNKIKKECVSLAALNLADRCLQILEDVLEVYDSKMNTIIKKAKKKVELSSSEIDYLVEMKKHLNND